MYRILDRVDDFTMIVSCRNVCIRLNAITDACHRYQVEFVFIKYKYLRYISSR